MGRPRSPSARPAAVLVDHRRVAALLGVSTATLRNWIRDGVFPRPHAEVKSLCFYRAADVDHFVKVGRWPEAMCKGV